MTTPIKETPMQETPIQETLAQEAPAEPAPPPLMDLAGIEAALIRAAEKAHQRARAAAGHGCCRDGHGAGEG